MRWSKLNDEALARRLGLFKIRGVVRSYRSEILASLKERRTYLYFLEGCHGTIQARKQRFGDLLSGWSKSSFLEVQRSYLHSREMESNPPPMFNMETGKVTYFKNGRAVEIRIGKYLRNIRSFALQNMMGLECPGIAYARLSSMIHYWENRSLSWDWRISTDPKDVFTMSTNRPWTSCMAFNRTTTLELCDIVEVGSVVMFFYRNDHEHPCGRVLLTPDVSRLNNPVVHVGDRYGSGPVYNDVFKTVQDLLAYLKTPEFNVQVHSDNPHVSVPKNLLEKMDKVWGRLGPDALKKAG